METKVIRTPKYKSVEDGFINVTEYHTSDDRVFYSKEEAEKYEKQLEKNKEWKAIECIDCKGDSQYCIGKDIHYWYRPNNEEELSMLLEYFKRSKYGYHEYGNIEVGKWIGYEYIDGGDYSDTHNVYELGYLKKEVEDYWKMFFDGRD
jgi:hypothetical protein